MCLAWFFSLQAKLMYSGGSSQGTSTCEASIENMCLHTARTRCNYTLHASCLNLYAGCCLPAAVASTSASGALRVSTASHTLGRERAALAAARKEEAAKRVAAMTTEEALAFRAECRKKRVVCQIALPSMFD